MTYDKADEAPEQSNTDRQSSSYGGEDVKATGGKLGTIQLTLGTAGHGTFTPCKRQVCKALTSNWLVTSCRGREG